VGLHYQLEPEPQGTLVLCPLGAIIGLWVAAELIGKKQQQLWVPVGFALGFSTLSEPVEVLYKASGCWSTSCERAVLWNNPEMAIARPLGQFEGAEPLLGGKEAAAPNFADAAAAGEVFA
jgi:dTDP-4-dehydrorhamnose 3,5-epimerase